MPSIDNTLMENMEPVLEDYYTNFYACEKRDSFAVFMLELRLKKLLEAVCFVMEKGALSSSWKMDAFLVQDLNLLGLVVCSVLGMQFWRHFVFDVLAASNLQSMPTPFLATKQEQNWLDVYLASSMNANR